jgi:hypothetical protein
LDRVATTRRPRTARFRYDGRLDVTPMYDYLGSVHVYSLLHRQLIKLRRVV